MAINGENMLTLYDYQAAPSPRRARIFLAEKGIEYKTVPVDLRAGEQMAEAFRVINPRCAVPALVTEDGDVITENVAIAAYLEALQPDPALMGKTPIEKARVLEWNWRAEFEGLAAIADILRNTSPHMKNRAMTGPKNYEQIPRLAKRGISRLGHFFTQMNTQLSASPYLAGPDYSLADITLFVGVDFSKWVKASPDESLTHLWAWYEKIAARPAVTD